MEDGYELERYLAIRSAYGASFGPAGDRLSFLMDTTGVPQVWTLDGPGRWPEQLTFGEDRATFAAWSPERPELVFGRDAGGDERMQLYRASVDGGDVHPLTDRPDAKHRWGGWSSDGERIAYASNRRDTAVFDVYVQSRDERGDEARRIYEGDGWLTVAGWSPDDRYVLLVESRSSFDQQLAVLEVETGERTDLTTHDESVRYWSTSWGPDGDALYVATDRDADTMYLARLDVPSGDLAVVEPGGEWNVDGVVVDEETGRVVYSRNVDGYTEVTVGELVDGTTISRFPTPDIPGDVAGGVRFDPDGERVAIAASGSTRNTNVYVVEVETGAVERWTRASTLGIPRRRFVEPSLIRFESFDGRSIPAFFSVPDGAEPGFTPVIVDVHGGPESQRRPSFSGVKQFLLDQGYAIFEPNVRGSTGYGRAYTHLDDVERRMDAVADLDAGVRWLRDRPIVDPDRIVALGGSYGGFMVLAALTEYPEHWAAGVDIVGIANFITFLRNTGDWRRSLREAEYGSLESDREFLDSISPINNVERIRAPLFVLHGENDPRVPVDEARQIAREASKHVPVETLVFPDEGHGITKLENRIEAYTGIVEFLDEYV